MPTNTFSSSLRAVKDQIPSLQHTAAVLDILKDGLNDPLDHTHLMVWRDITEMSLAHEVDRLYHSIDELLATIAAAMKEETL